MRSLEDGNGIFEIVRLRGLLIKVEGTRKLRVQQQCYRSQEFGHVQFRCTGKVVCVFCAGEHSLRNCDRSRDKQKAARCRN